MIQTPYNLICISHLPWSTMWKRDQSLIDRLSRSPQIHRVIFVNPAVWLTDLIFDYRNQVSSSHQKLYKFSWKAAFPRKVGDKVTAVTPVQFIPLARSRPNLARLQMKFHKWELNRLLQGRDYILFLNDYNYNPERRKLAEALLEKAKFVVFDWSDDFIEFSEDPVVRGKINEVCEYYVRTSDVVLTVNESLTQRAVKLNTHSYTISNGADIERLSIKDNADREVPEALRSLSKPLIGYVGWITPTRIDSELLSHLARTRPDWTLVLMGPVYEKFSRTFESHKNIVFLPPVDYQVLSRYLNCFDVCIIPHRVNDHTRGNDPLKVYTYLAAGKPVVSTPISGLDSFKNVVYISKDQADFTRLIEQAMKEDGIQLRKERFKKAEENSWTSRADDIWKILEDHLTQPKRSRPE